MLYDKYLTKDGKEILKCCLLYINRDSICDMCDEKADTAILKAIDPSEIGGDHIHICKKCLLDITNEF